jgi:hypothetical protein
VKALLDYFIGASEQLRRHGNSERLRGLQLDHELERDWLFGREVFRPRSLR